MPTPIEGNRTPAELFQFWADAARKSAEESALHFVLARHSDDPERRARVLEGVAAMPQHVLASAWQSILETDSASAAEAFGKNGTPGLYIGAARPLANLSRLRELCPQVIIAQTAGAGHFCQLEVPEQVNAMIDRFLKVSVE